MYAFAHATLLSFGAYYDAMIIYDWLDKIDKKNGDMKKMTAEEGIKALLFGVMLGAGGYLAGVAVSVRADTILQMVGMNGYSGTNKLYNNIKSVNTD